MILTEGQPDDNKLIEVLNLYPNTFYKFAWIMRALHCSRGEEGIAELCQNLDAYARIQKAKLESEPSA
jgi:hypothetical protein